MLLVLAITVVWLTFFFAGLRLGQKRSMVNRLILSSPTHLPEWPDVAEDKRQDSSFAALKP